MLADPDCTGPAGVGDRVDSGALAAGQRTRGQAISNGAGPSGKKHAGGPVANHRGPQRLPGAGVSTWWNQELVVEPANAEDAHRGLGPEHDLAAILSHIELREVLNNYNCALRRIALSNGSPGYAGRTAQSPGTGTAAIGRDQPHALSSPVFAHSPLCRGGESGGPIASSRATSSLPRKADISTFP